MSTYTTEEEVTTMVPIKPVIIEAINPKSPRNIVEKHALMRATTNKHPLRRFREVGKEIDPKTKEKKIVARNELHKFHNDIIRRVQKSGYTEEDLKKMGYNSYIEFFKGISDDPNDVVPDDEQDRRGWRAMRLSPEKETIWFMENNIGRKRYNKFVKDFSKGWEEGGNSETFRNSPYRYIGLGLSALMALPLLEFAAPMIGEAGAATLPTLKGAAATAGKAGTALALGEAAYDASIPYLKEYQGFRDMQHAVNKGSYTDYDGAMKADAEGKRYEKDLDTLGKWFEKLVNDFNTRCQEYENSGVYDEATYNQLLKEQENLKLLESELDRKLGEGDKRLESYETAYNNGMQLTRKAKIANGVVGVGNILSSTREDNVSPGMKALSYGLDGLNLGYLKNLKLAKAGLSELAPAILQSYTNDIVLDIDEYARKKSDWYNKYVNSEIATVPLAIAFGVPVNKAAAKNLNIVNDGINTYRTIKHGGIGTDYYNFRNGKFKYDKTIYPDGTSITNRWFTDPDNIKTYISGENGNGGYFDKTQGIFMQGTTPNTKSPLIIENK